MAAMVDKVALCSRHCLRTAKYPSRQGGRLLRAAQLLQQSTVCSDVAASFRTLMRTVPAVVNEFTVAGLVCRVSLLEHCMATTPDTRAYERVRWFPACE